MQPNDYPQAPSGHVLLTVIQAKALVAKNGCPACGASGHNLTHHPACWFAAKLAHAGA